MTDGNWFDSIISNLVNAFESVFLKKTDIEDNLTSNNSSKVLSAKQGKELKTLVDGISIPSPSSTTPSADTLNGDVGNGVTWARSNHKHPKSDLYAESNHGHGLSDLDNVDTVSVVVTYTDNTTGNLNIVVQTTSQQNNGE